MNNNRVAFLGLGVMGYPMAGLLSQAGIDVTVYNRTTAKAQQWSREFRGKTALTPAEAAEHADIIITCVGNDDDVRQVMTGPDGVLSGADEGCIVIDHTTASAGLAKELYALAKEKKCDFLDAPVSGGQAGAQQGRLTIMVGGDESAFDRVKPLLSFYAQAVTRMGPSGSGQQCKMVNQICIAGVLQGLAEGLHFAQSVGLDAHRVVDVISKGAAQSWQMENRFETMLKDQYDHGFAVDWMRKDLWIALEEARSSGVSLPLTSLVDQFYSDVQSMGGNRWDTSSLLKRLQQLHSAD